MTWRNDSSSAPRRRGGTSGDRGSVEGLKTLLSALVILGIVGAVAWSWWGRDDDSSDTKASKGSQEWTVGGCGGPDPDNGPDGYQVLDCKDSAATMKVLKLEDAGVLPGSVQCPGGTDLIVQVSMSFGAGDAGGGLPTKTVCGRNLSADHPGDPGQGGGQLVKGDCVNSTAAEIACGSGDEESIKVLDLVSAQEECPAGTTQPLELIVQVGRPYSWICGGAA
ncbi:hypothetical protein AQ490_05710 [Wenjunlia vitaminophila]|uniref:Uncharacterized protein n=1 Tax=Wenjunlia vitaminophila TaxID=76728 RepID=A0A0T6LPR4_WENVI|nr:hypothetical protein [Wenjunlia vitaminophila]KRV47855.1 hypothetical protein AQ490_05710 [Wenjunlia vitaminophila]